MADKDAEYATPTVPVASDVVVIESGATTLKVKDFVAVWFGEEESVTLMPADEVLTVVGVPEIVPVLGLSVKPAGKAPDAIDHVYGSVPPVAAIVVEYALPVIPVGTDVVVMVSVAGGGAGAAAYAETIKKQSRFKTHTAARLSDMELLHLARFQKQYERETRPERTQASAVTYVQRRNYLGSWNSNENASWEKVLW